MIVCISNKIIIRLVFISISYKNNNIYKLAKFIASMIKKTTETKQNVTEEDVLRKIAAFSPELQLEYLENLAVRTDLSQTVRKIVCKKSSELYERKNMYFYAANKMKIAGELSLIPAERKEIFMKEGMLWLKATEYMNADDAFRKAIDAETQNNKKQLQKNIRALYYKEAENFEGVKKLAKAIDVYERIIRTQEEGEDMNTIKLKLSELYGRVGRIPESINLRKSIPGQEQNF